MAGRPDHPGEVLLRQLGAGLRAGAAPAPAFSFGPGLVRQRLIGYRCPAYVKGMNVPGYHLYFLAADGKRGGHVLDFTLEKGVVKTEQYAAFALQLPASGDFLEVDLTTDKAEELQKVEK